MVSVPDDSDTFEDLSTVFTTTRILSLIHI